MFDTLKQARKRRPNNDDKNAFSPTEATGVGKTVMATAVILLIGDPSIDVQPPGRLQDASDTLAVSNITTIEKTSGAGKFQPGKVDFLNTPKLSKRFLLVRRDA